MRGVTSFLKPGACGSTSATPGSPSATIGTATGGDFARLVSIGGGRSIFLECRRIGSPTVVLVSGTGGASDEWADAVNPADPTAAPKTTATAVLPSVASFTRVCAYDRPGTTLDDGDLSPSTLVRQPTTVLVTCGQCSQPLGSIRRMFWSGPHGER